MAQEEWEQKETEVTLLIKPQPCVLQSSSPKTSFSLSSETAASKVSAYNQDIQSEENGLYKSWEHCYSYFAMHRNQPLGDEHIDLLCLHLAFYLASWGMYRGSSFLRMCLKIVSIFAPLQLENGQKRLLCWHSLEYQNQLRFLAYPEVSLRNSLFNMDMFSNLAPTDKELSVVFSVS